MGPSLAKLGQARPKWGQAGPSWAKIKMKHKLSGEENFKKGKIRKTRLNSNGRSVSKIGKILAQNWKSDPMNSPKAFGELKNV